MKAVLLSVFFNTVGLTVNLARLLTRSVVATVPAADHIADPALPMMGDVAATVALALLIIEGGGAATVLTTGEGVLAATANPQCQIEGDMLAIE